MSVNEVKIKKAATAFELRGTGPPTSRTFVLGDEDHTLGNSLRHVLINDARVDFAGYCVPHPSEPVVHIRVQSSEHARKKSPTVEDDDEMIEGNDDEDGPLTAIDALKEACATLSNQCDLVLEKLEGAAPEVKEDRVRMDRLTEEDLRNEEEEGVDEEEEEGEEC